MTDMTENNYPEISADNEQLKKYAQDLADIYSQEKAKRKELEASNLQLKEFSGALNSITNELKLTNAELKDAYLDTIYRLVLAAEYKDEDTGKHITRTSRYCALVAEHLDLPGHEIEILFSAAPMHDVGKISIPDNILMKPGKLTDTEFNIIKTHTLAGAKILSNSKGKVIQAAEQIALTHHEKWNGKGYPQGLVGQEIPLIGRIVGIVDVFDALTSLRPYKDPYPLEIALNIINKERGEHFDPDVTDVFIKHIDQIMEIKNEVDLAASPSLTDFTWSARDIDANHDVNL